VKATDIDASEDSEREEQFNAEEDFRMCGQKIAELLKSGEEITDEVYVELFVAKLRNTYPIYEKSEIRSK
jgi:hypothetical protein